MGERRGFGQRWHRRTEEPTAQPTPPSHLAGHDAEVLIVIGHRIRGLMTVADTDAESALLDQVGQLCLTEGRRQRALLQRLDLEMHLDQPDVERFERGEW